MGRFLLILFAACMLVSIGYSFNDQIGLATYWLALAIINLINYHNS